MGLSQTVTGLCSIHVDVQYALHPMTSWEAFCPDNLHIASFLAAYGGCGHWAVCHGCCTQTVDSLEAKMGHQVDWCVKVFWWFFCRCSFLLFFKARRLYGKCRLKFGGLQTFLRSYSWLTLTFLRRTSHKCAACKCRSKYTQGNYKISLFWRLKMSNEISHLNTEIQSHVFKSIICKTKFEDTYFHLLNIFALTL